MEKINLLEQITSLKEEIFNFKQKSGDANNLSVECNNLKNVIDEQQKKIIQYEEELQRTKEHIVKLESLIQTLQDGKSSHTVSENWRPFDVFSITSQKLCLNIMQKSFFDWQTSLLKMVCSIEVPCFLFAEVWDPESL